MECVYYFQFARIKFRLGCLTPRDLTAILRIDKVNTGATKLIKIIKEPLARMVLFTFVH